MELQRNQATLDFWELAADFTATQEEKTEMIVPDHCPDIARILSSEGNVFLQHSEIREGKTALSGSVQISVLYIPEQSATVQSMTFVMPFQITEACPQECSQIRAAVSAESITARILNPRKIRLQCRLAANINAYRFVSANYTCGVNEDLRLGMELMPQQETVEFVTALSDKEFTCQDTLHLPQNRGALSTILSSRIHCTIEDTKIIGTKAIVKGRYLAVILAKYESGACENSIFELPFSHITEIDAAQNARLSATQVLTGLTLEPEINEDGGTDLHISVMAQLQLSVSESKEITVIRDLYSTAFELETEYQELKLLDAAGVQTRRQVFQDTLEIGIPAERVLQLSAACGAVTMGRDGNDVPELRTTLHLHALYLTEDSRVLSAERSAEVCLSCPDTAGSMRCWATCGEESSSVMTGDGMIVRIPVDFHLKPQTFRTIRYVSSVSFDENAPKDLSQLPSLVLRRKKLDESLWDLAKRHNSAVQDILTANECGSESELRPEQLLLIPRRRG